MREVRLPGRSHAGAGSLLSLADKGVITMTIGRVLFITLCQGTGEKICRYTYARGYPLAPRINLPTSMLTCHVTRQHKTIAKTLLSLSSELRDAVS